MIILLGELQNVGARAQIVSCRLNFRRRRHPQAGTLSFHAIAPLFWLVIGKNMSNIVATKCMWRPCSYRASKWATLFG